MYDPRCFDGETQKSFAGALEKMLEAEMDEHLGYEKNSVLGNNSGNSRNGYKKTVKSEWGESEISVPRDRNGTFEPRIIEKRQTRTDDIEARIWPCMLKECPLAILRITCAIFTE